MPKLKRCLNLSSKFSKLFFLVEPNSYFGVWKCFDVLIIFFMKYFKTLFFYLFTFSLFGQTNVEINLEKPYLKGYRLDGRRHPHSWSIVEPVDCINWILECLK